MSMTVHSQHVFSPGNPSQMVCKKSLSPPSRNLSPIQCWERAGFCDAMGHLLFLPDLEPHPLQADALAKWAALLGKPLTIGDHLYSYQAYLETVSAAFPNHQLFLRGSYASYVLDPLRELRFLIDAYLQKHPQMEALMEQGWERLTRESTPLIEPADADWALIADHETTQDELLHIKHTLIQINSKLGEVDYLKAKNETFTNLIIARKNELTSTEDPIVIASLQNRLDLLVGSPQVSPCLFSYDNRYIPIQKNSAPFALNGSYWQSTLDHALGIIRLESRHALDFRALLVAIKHLSTGKRWMGSSAPYIAAFNAFIKKGATSAILTAIESKMPTDPVHALCYVMNLLSLIDEESSAKKNELWQVLQNKVAVNMPYTFEELSNALYGFENMPFLVKTHGRVHPDLVLSIKKTLLLNPQSLPAPADRGLYADWLYAISNGIQSTIAKTLLCLVDGHHLSDDECQRIQQKWGGEGPLNATHLLNILITEGNFYAYFPLWLERHFQGNWEDTIKQLLSLSGIKPRRGLLKHYFVCNFGDVDDKQTLYFILFKQLLFQPDIQAKRLFLEHFQDMNGERLAHYLQNLAPFIRDKMWIVDLWIESFLLQRMDLELLEKRIVIWLTSHLPLEQKQALVIDLFHRCGPSTFSGECLKLMLSFLNDSPEMLEILRSLLSSMSIKDFLSLIDELAEVRASSTLLETHLWQLLHEHKLKTFAELLMHPAWMRRVQISQELLSDQLRSASLTPLELNELIPVQHPPLTQALVTIPLELPQQESLAKQCFGASSVQERTFVYQQVSANPAIYVEELKKHYPWLIDALKKDGEKLYHIYLILFHLQIPAQLPPPVALVDFIHSQNSEEIHAPLCLSLMRSNKSMTLALPVLNRILSLHDLALFRQWLSVALVYVIAHHQASLISLLKGSKDELLALLESLSHQSVKCTNTLIEELLKNLCVLQGGIEEVDFGILAKLPMCRPEAYQPFLVNAERTSRFINEYLLESLPTSGNNALFNELLTQTIERAIHFELLHLFLDHAPRLRKILPHNEPCDILRRYAGRSYLLNDKGSYEWLFAMETSCDEPLISQICIQKLSLEGIDFLKDVTARTYLFQMLVDLIAIRQQKPAEGENHLLIGDSLVRIFSDELLRSSPQIPQGLFAWFNDIGSDPFIPALVRLNLLLRSVKYGPPDSHEESFKLLFKTLPEIDGMDLEMLEGPLFATVLYPSLPTKSMHDLLTRLTLPSGSMEQRKREFNFHFLKLIDINRSLGNPNERLLCAKMLFQAAIAAKIDLSRKTYATEIIKTITLNFFAVHGEAIKIKDLWINAVSQVQEGIPQVESQWICLSEIMEKTLDYSDAETFSGLLVMVAEEFSSVVKKLYQGVKRTHPHLIRFLHKTISHRHFTRTSMQCETLIAILPFIGENSSIYLFILMFMTKDLMVPEGTYQNSIRQKEEIQLFVKALELYGQREDGVAAEGSRRIYQYALKKHFSIPTLMKLFEITVLNHVKAKLPLEWLFDMAAETFTNQKKPLNEKQQYAFIEIIERYRNQIPH